MKLSSLVKERENPYVDSFLGGIYNGVSLFSGIRFDLSIYHQKFFR